MDVVSGTEASASTAALDRVLDGIRTLTALADSASDADTIFRTLAAELQTVPGAEEVHVHCLAAPGTDDDDLVAVYLAGGQGRISYLQRRAERAPGVSWVASTGHSFLAAEAAELASSVPRLAETGEMGSAVLLPLFEHAEPRAVAVLVRRRGQLFSADDVGLGRALVEQAGTALALVRARAEAGTDVVTGSMNHRAMRRRLEEEIGRAMRTGTPLSCLLLDLDDFKQVNDRYGHPAGDRMLREVVQALMGEFRAFDRVARYGGDEFVVILPNAELTSASAAATRALQRLREIQPYDGARTGISASVGAAQWEPPMSTDDLLQACDVALLRAKRQGKGRVTSTREPSR